MKDSRENQLLLDAGQPFYSKSAGRPAAIAGEVDGDLLVEVRGHYRLTVREPLVAKPRVRLGKRVDTRRRLTRRLPGFAPLSCCPAAPACHAFDQAVGAEDLRNWPEGSPSSSCRGVGEETTRSSRCCGAGAISSPATGAHRTISVPLRIYRRRRGNGELRTATSRRSGVSVFVISHRSPVPSCRLISRVRRDAGAVSAASPGTDLQPSPRLEVRRAIATTEQQPLLPAPHRTLASSGTCCTAAPVRSTRSNQVHFVAGWAGDITDQAPLGGSSTMTGPTPSRGSLLFQPEPLRATFAGQGLRVAHRRRAYRRVLQSR